MNLTDCFRGNSEAAELFLLAVDPYKLRSNANDPKFRNICSGYRFDEFEVQMLEDENCNPSTINLLVIKYRVSQDDADWLRDFTKRP